MPLSPLKQHYISMREEKLTTTALAKKLHCDKKEVRRMLNPYYYSKLPSIEHALNMLGQQLEISVSRL